jgi:ribonuclease HI
VAVVSLTETLWAESLPPSTSVQLDELIALTKALQLSERKTANIYTDSKYAFLVLHAHAALWKKRVLLTTEGSPIKHSKETLNLLKAASLPKQTAVIHCPRHQRSEEQVAKGNQKPDMAAKEATMRPCVQAPVLWEQSFLPSECPLYSPTENSQASKRGYCLDHRGWWATPEGKLFLPQSSNGRS